MDRKSERIKLIDFGSQPIAHRMLATATEEEFTHPFSISLCESSGLVRIDDPIAPEELYTNYFCLSEWKWQPHIPQLATRIEEISELAKDDFILEVGSNDGGFLEVLKERGFQNVLGIEPANDALASANKRGVETIPGYFTPELAAEIVAKRGQCDLFVSRQVLEHIGDLDQYREALSTVLRPGGFALIEVPDFQFSLDTGDYSAIWEEHVNYFTLPSLSHFMAQAGIEVQHSETVNFSGQGLVALGRRTAQSLAVDSIENLDQLRAKALAYRDYWPTFRDRFLEYLQQARRDGKRIAVYGAGCRACSLINFTGAAPYIDFMVDDQLEKQNKFMPGSRLPVLPTSALRDQSVDICLLTVNSENDEKVIAKHQTLTESGLVFVPVLPPSENLPDFFWQNVQQAHAN